MEQAEEVCRQCRSVLEEYVEQISRTLSLCTRELGAPPLHQFPSKGKGSKAKTEKASNSNGKENMHGHTSVQSVGKLNTTDAR